MLLSVEPLLLLTKNTEVERGEVEKHGLGSWYKRFTMVAIGGYANSILLSVTDA